MVFHVAADYRLWVRDPEQMYRSNVEGTRAITGRGAQEAACGASFTPRAWRRWASATNGTLADEESSSIAGGHDRAITSGRSSWRSRLRWKLVERVRRCGGQSHDANRRVGYQADSYGANSCGFPEEEVSGVCGYGIEPGGCHRVCARTRAALEKGRSGERYILGGENLTLKQILDKLAAITGLPSPKVKLPYAVGVGIRRGR